VNNIVVILFNKRCAAFLCREKNIRDEYFVLLLLYLMCGGMRRLIAFKVGGRCMNECSCSCWRVAFGKWALNKNNGREKERKRELFNSKLCCGGMRLRCPMSMMMMIRYKRGNNDDTKMFQLWFDCSFIVCLLFSFLNDFGALRCCCCYCYWCC
jgi:hypothetical protein